MSKLRSFIPWVVYGVVSSAAGWRVGAPAALAAGALGVWRARREGSDTDVLAVATMCFFAGTAVVAALDPGSPLHRYVPALALATLGVASIASIIQGRPFTEAFAKQQVAPELWSTPLFRQANVTITGVWAASFLTTAGATATMLAVAPHAVGMLAALQVLGIVIPVRFTSIYRARLRARLAASSVLAG